MKPKPPSELSIQAALRSRIANVGAGISLVAVPNGQRRSQWEMNRAIKEGLSIGFPDLMALAPGGKIAFIEVKRPGARMSASQSDWETHLIRWGFRIAVVRSADEGEAFLRGCGFPFLNPQPHPPP